MPRFFHREEVYGVETAVSTGAWVSVITACVPILVALVGIIPTIISNRKKTEESIQSLQATLDRHIREDEDQTAQNRRYRILRFYDELCEHKRHSESHFEDIMDDIGEYKVYCGKHKDDFRNGRGEAAMEYIEETYKRLKASGDFLVHN